MKSFRRPSLVLLTTGLLLSACQIVPDAQPDPTRFFVLEDPMSSANASLESDAVTIGLMGVRLPVYLADNRAMAVTTPDHQVKYRDFDRWAEPLHEGIERVFGSALAREPAIARVMTLPFSTDVARDFDLQINVRQCEGFLVGSNPTIRFALDYSVLGTDGELLLHDVYQSSGTDWNGEPGELARLLSRAIADAAAKIAASLPAPD
ncbi:MAG: hypothetical protein SynsKO_26670 [Synoicihabitans sp.]